MHRLLHFTFYIAFSSLFGCASNKPSAPAVPFNDDLTQYRIKIESPTDKLPGSEDEPVRDEPLPPPSLHISGKVDAKLGAMALKNNEITKMRGFRVLVYSGNSRDDANKMLKDLKDEFEHIRTVLTYEVPNYKVKMGNFQDKTDAHTLLVKVKETHPGAILVNDNIDLFLDDYK